MQPGGSFPGPAQAAARTLSGEPDDPAARLAASAKGWHSIQLAVLGFIGVCGVLRDGSAVPGWIEVLAGGLAFLALVFAGLAIYLVGRVAYPFYGSTAGIGPLDLDRLAGQLRAGIRATFLAAASIAIAAVSGWWPSDAGTAAGVASGSVVQVRDAAGRTVCGELLDSSGGTVRINTSGGPISLRLDRLAAISPVDSC